MFCRDSAGRRLFDGPYRRAVQMGVPFAAQSHPNPRSKPEASSHIHSNSEARVSASRLHLFAVQAHQTSPARSPRAPLGKSSQPIAVSGSLAPVTLKWRKRPSRSKDC